LQIEQTIQVNINAYAIGDDKGRMRYPLFVSRQHFPQSVDLLYANDHWFCIRSFSRFMSDVTKHNGHKFFCRRCLGHFSTQPMLDKHTPYCDHDDFSEEHITMPDPGEMLKFSNRDWPAIQFAPFTVYADFESLTMPIDERVRQTTRYQRHVPCSYGLKMVSRCAAINSMDYESYTGEDCVEHFLARLLELRDLCAGAWDQIIEMSMTWRDWDKYRAATHCTGCKKAFVDGDVKVRDHCHLSGRFRGVMHQACNLKSRQVKHLHVFIHNFRGYDSHLIMRAFRLSPERTLHVVGQSMEKYLTIDWGHDISFKDSYQFLTASLERLVKSMEPSKFTNVRDDFRLIYIVDIIERYRKKGLLLAKGVYPYDYMNAWARFEEDHLPVRAAFDNGLRDEPCSEADYARAKAVWAEFGCRTMKDYHDHYLKCDVLQLADLFEEFRNQFHFHYGLDPAQFITTPQLSWAAMLRFCQVKRPL
ncbi:MAG: hypothetical protein FD144_5943, partial [Rhodospirillaceae bacterium]